MTDGTAITVDTLVDGVHWNHHCSAADVGYKAVAVSVSDLAAMGARPRWMLLSLSVPQPVDPAWIADFSTGVAHARATFGVALIGGDTTRSPVISVSVTMAGTLVGPALCRHQARPGDDLWVTGVPGLAGMGYLRSAPSDAALQLFRRPVPPLEFALALAEAGLAHGAMDLSDGLALDLPRLCASSRVGANVDPDLLPWHPAFDADGDVRQLQLSAGDDYQLLFGAAPEAREACAALAHRFGAQLTRIGRFTEAPAVALSDGSWPAPAFDHFGGPS